MRATLRFGKVVHLSAEEEELGTMQHPRRVGGAVPSLLQRMGSKFQLLLHKSWTASANKVCVSIALSGLYAL